MNTTYEIDAMGTLVRGRITKREPGWVHLTTLDGEQKLYPDWFPCREVPDFTFGNR